VTPNRFRLSRTIWPIVCAVYFIAHYDYSRTGIIVHFGSKVKEILPHGNKSRYQQNFTREVPDRELLGAFL
jgi:hypothetical protein